METEPGAMPLLEESHEPGVGVRALSRSCQLGISLVSIQSAAWLSP